MIEQTAEELAEAVDKLELAEMYLVVRAELEGLKTVVRAKLEKNKQRGFRHGGKRV